MLGKVESSHFQCQNANFSAGISNLWFYKNLRDSQEGNTDCIFFSMQNGQFQPKLLEMCKPTSNWGKKIYNEKYQLTMITAALCPASQSSANLQAQHLYHNELGISMFSPNQVFEILYVCLLQTKPTLYHCTRNADYFLLLTLEVLDARNRFTFSCHLLYHPSFCSSHSKLRNDASPFQWRLQTLALKPHPSACDVGCTLQTQNWSSQFCILTTSFHVSWMGGYN